MHVAEHPKAQVGGEDRRVDPTPYDPEDHLGIRLGDRVGPDELAHREDLPLLLFLAIASDAQKAREIDPFVHGHHDLDAVEDFRVGGGEEVVDRADLDHGSREHGGVGLRYLDSPHREVRR